MDANRSRRREGSVTTNAIHPLWVALCVLGFPCSAVCDTDVYLNADRSALVLAMAADQKASAAITPSAQDRMKSCDRKVALHAAEEILGDASNLEEPLGLFTPALVLFENGRKDDAVFWFYAAQLRTRYQLVFEKEDRGQLLSVMLMTTGSVINNYAFQDVTKLDRTLDRVLQWDRKTPNSYRERAQTEDQTRQITGVYSGLDELKAKLAAEKADLEQQARAAAPGIEHVRAEHRAKRCDGGGPDPAGANQVIAKEWQAVFEFVKNNQDVIRATGGVIRVHSDSSKLGANEILPRRYVTAVTSERETVYAVVDVSRASGEAQFTLACITRGSLGARLSRKDMCDE